MNKPINNTQPKTGISIVIPALNEGGTLTELVQRLCITLNVVRLPYELILIDDHSIDATAQIANELSQYFPLHRYIKVGQPGKAFSLLEGFSHARFSIVGMIDADLEYPPEAFGAMIARLASGGDVVIGRREYRQASPIREARSTVFRRVFGGLNGVDLDVQSGMKLFRREILDRITLTPSPWTFDLDFLLQARDAGYTLDEVPIILSERRYGQSKVKGSQASWEIGKAAIKSRLRSPQPIPTQDVPEVGHKGGFHFKQQLFRPFNSLDYAETALTRLSRSQTGVLMVILLLIGVSLVISWRNTLIGAIAIITAYYFIDLLFSFFLVYRSFSKVPEIKFDDQVITEFTDRASWPSYTIFCPLYKEWAVLPQFVEAISRLEYPHDKLQVLLLLESDDIETQTRAQEMGLPDWFEIVIVPDSLPKTKPKACNYGLAFAKGEYSVIYDAEDQPDPLQLKKAITSFENASDSLICVQAKLNFYNPQQNILTRIFTAEYSLWFDLILSGLQSLRGPIPLGGTSNHFRSEALRRVGGWDAFNVTEDCDLGMRLAAQGYQTAIIDSVTLEEANSDFKNWFHQRTRWIKGYIQTYFVHMRQPTKLGGNWRQPNLLIFQLVVGGKVAAMFINPLMWVLTAVYFIFRASFGPTIESFYPAPVLFMGVVSLVFGNFLYVYSYMIGCARHGHWGLLKYVFLVPLYWLFMSAAAWKALYQFIVNPHYWAKTKHGLHLDSHASISTDEVATA